MLKVFLWLRYLHKRKIVLLSITAVALSAGMLIVVASLFTGFISAFEQSAVELMGDVVVSAPVSFSNYREFIETLEDTGDVEAATPVLTGRGLLHLGAGNVRAVQIWGIEPQSRARVCGFANSLLGGDGLPGPDSDDSGQQAIGYVGIGLVTEPDPASDEYDFDAAREIIGKRVVLTTGAIKEVGGAVGPRAEVKRKTFAFTVADIVFTGVYGIDSGFLYLPIEQFQRQLYPDEDGERAQMIHIKLAGGCNEAAAVAQIRGLWVQFASEKLNWGQHLISFTDIETSRRMQSRYVLELRKQMGVLLLIFGVASLSVIALVFCIFYMIVMTRQRDVAIIRACGATSSSVAGIFVGFGGFVGLIGAAAGVGLGYIVIKNINVVEQWIRIVFGLKLWKSSVYIFSRIPNEIDWGWAQVIGISAVAAAAVGALIPALAAARCKPVDILRYE